MKKEEQNPVFQIWLAAYNSRLVQVAQSKPPAPPQSADQPATQPDTPSPEKLDS